MVYILVYVFLLYSLLTLDCEPTCSNSEFLCTISFYYSELDSTYSTVLYRLDQQKSQEINRFNFISQNHTNIYSTSFCTMYGYFHLAFDENHLLPPEVDLQIVLESSKHIPLTIHKFPDTTVDSILFSYLENNKTDELVFTRFRIVSDKPKRHTIQLSFNDKTMNFQLNMNHRTYYMFLPPKTYLVQSVGESKAQGYLYVEYYDTQQWIDILEGNIYLHNLVVNLVNAAMNQNTCQIECKDGNIPVYLKAKTGYYSSLVSLHIQSLSSSVIFYNKTAFDDYSEWNHTICLPHDEYQAVIQAHTQLEQNDFYVQISLFDGTVLCEGRSIPKHYSSVWHFSTKYMIKPNSLWSYHYVLLPDKWYQDIDQYKDWEQNIHPNLLKSSSSGYFWNQFEYTKNKAYSTIEFRVDAVFDTTVRLNDHIIFEKKNIKQVTTYYFDIPHVNLYLQEKMNIITVEVQSNYIITIQPIHVYARYQLYEEQRTVNGLGMTIPYEEGYFASEHLFDKNCNTFYATNKKCHDVKMQWEYEPHRSKIITGYELTVVSECFSTMPTAWSVYGVTEQGEQTLLDQMNIKERYIFSPNPHQILVWSFNNSISYHKYMFIVDKCDQFPILERTPCNDRKLSLASLDFITIKALDKCYIKEVDKWIRHNEIGFLPCPEGYKGTIRLECKNGQLSDPVNTCEEIYPNTFYYDEQYWDLAVDEEMKPQIPIITGVYDSVVVDMALPYGLRLNKTTGAVTGIPTIIQSKSLYVFNTKGASKSMSYDIYISVHPIIGHDPLEDYKNIFSVVIIISVVITMVAFLIILKNNLRKVTGQL